MFWAVVQWVAIFALSYLAQPQQPTTKVQPGDLSVPTTDEGKEMPVLFGTKEISMNIVWHGHRRVQAIKKRGGKK